MAWTYWRWVKQRCIVLSDSIRYEKHITFEYIDHILFKWKHFCAFGNFELKKTIEMHATFFCKQNINIDFFQMYACIVSLLMKWMKGKTIGIESIVYIKICFDPWKKYHRIYFNYCMKSNKSLIHVQI